jgi:5-deoxy-glucuronate isomerase
MTDHSAAPTHPWHIPLGHASTRHASVWLDPGSRSLEWCGLRVIQLAAEAFTTFATGRLEMAVLPLSGSVSVEVEGHRFGLVGRTGVFDSVTDWAYLPIDAEVRISALNGPVLLALPSARAEERHDPVRIDAGDVPVELRGAGPSSRQLNNFMAPEVFDGAHRLMCTEVLTPDGNWSSYPPHRHDGEGECTVNNEEIYYFRVGSTVTGDCSPDGFAIHRTYTDDGEVDVNVAVRDGDVFTIPRGYHGPCVAPPGYPLYYLNVLAGPTGERTMAFCDDPTHHWVRSSWEGMAVDRRLPMTSASGPVGPAPMIRKTPSQ